MCQALDRLFQQPEISVACSGWSQGLEKRLFPGRMAGRVHEAAQSWLLWLEGRGRAQGAQKEPGAQEPQWWVLPEFPEWTTPPFCGTCPASLFDWHLSDL